MSHLKRLTAPRTWHIPRKEKKYIVRPLPGSHSRATSLPLQLVIRDILSYASTARQVRRMLLESKVLVDGKVRKEARSSVGIFDVIHFAPTKEDYRVLLDSKGCLSIRKIDHKESSLKICKVVGKKIIKGGKVQFSLHDGRTMVGDIKVNVGDSLLLKFPEAKVEESIPLKKGAYIYLTKGKYSGTHGILESIENDEIFYHNDKNNKIRTNKKYAVAVGEGKPRINLEYGSKQ